MKIYVTGAGGFVGGHLVAHLQERGHEVVGAGRAVRPPFDSLDITDAESLGESVGRAAPDAVVHLAAQPSVPESWLRPADTYRVNVLGTLNLLEALKGSNCRLLLIGSAQQYGPLKGEALPIKESHSMEPNSPYAASKIAAEELAFVYHRIEGLDVVATRSFNHTGPGQSSEYVVGSFARQIASIERGVTQPKMEVGDLSPRRDILDVRDVVAAYLALLEKGQPGEAYNVCSGLDVAVGEILELMLKSAGLLGQVEVVERSTERKGDPSVIVGDPSKLRSTSGWKPEMRLETSLVDTLDWYRSRGEGT